LHKALDFRLFGRTGRRLHLDRCRLNGVGDLLKTPDGRLRARRVDSKKWISLLCIGDARQGKCN
jgi:hypothetical protein